MRMVVKQFVDTLERMGIKRIAAVGKPFDPSVHEAIQQIESTEHPAGVVIAEVQPGYMHGRLPGPRGHGRRLEGLARRAGVRSELSFHRRRAPAPPAHTSCLDAHHGGGPLRDLLCPATSPHDLPKYRGRPVVCPPGEHPGL